MIDSRKPLAPNRPGRYLLRDGTTTQIDSVDNGIGRCANGAAEHWDYGQYEGPNGLNPKHDIVDFSCDDAAWCLAQARLLCPDGYAVVPVSNPRCAICGAEACVQIRLDPFGKSDATEGRCAEHGPKLVIAAATEGK